MVDERAPFAALCRTVSRSAVPVLETTLDSIIAPSYAAYDARLNIYGWLEVQALACYINPGTVAGWIDCLFV